MSWEECLGSIALGRDVVKTLINLFPRRLAVKLVPTVGEFGSRERLERLKEELKVFREEEYLVDR